MTQEQLIQLLEELVAQPHETEWLEFKHNFHSAEEIGERLSALSNGACLRNRPKGYLVYGVEDGTHNIIGTTFKAKQHKKGNEELEIWLTNRLNPRIDFEVYEFDYDAERHISIFIVPAVKNRPIEFLHKAYIRVGSSTKNLQEYPEKAAKIWRKDATPFEQEIAKSNVAATEITNYLHTQAYFDLMNLPYPTNLPSVISKFIEEKILIKTNGNYAITNLGAMLLAKNLKNFESLERKSVRVVVYKGSDKLETVREQIGHKGYAVGFEGLITWVHSQLPANEEIGKALRTETTMYPPLAIRELIANALIHQDLYEKGFPMIEIFSDRIEISNPGTPIVAPDRFIDSYLSRNEKLTDTMRRMRFCEERGSGMDKVIAFNELYQLPPIEIAVNEHRTTVIMYSYKPLNLLDKEEKIRACYQHACLKYVSRKKMNNQTLRERFKIDEKSNSIASRIIQDTVNAGLIKDADADNKSKKFANYLPFWA